MIDVSSFFHKRSTDFDLDRFKSFLGEVRNPHLYLKNIIHIAGTNGKGSTLFFLKQLLVEHGFLVAGFISPHVIDYSERIFINDESITQDFIDNTLGEWKKASLFDTLSFFEITTALFFEFCRWKKHDYVLLEVGLGGRLDATNVVDNKLLNIITAIGFDHEAFLGNSLKEIVFEKCGIISDKADVLVARQYYEDVNTNIVETASNRGSRVYCYGNDYVVDGDEVLIKSIDKVVSLKNISLLGNHQIYNSASAVFAGWLILKDNFDVSLVEKSLALVKHVGRLQRVDIAREFKIEVKNPYACWIDGAHNPMGVMALANFIKLQGNDPTFLIFQMLKTKKLLTSLSLLKDIKELSIYAINSSDEQFYGGHEVEKVCREIGLKCKVIDSFKEAIIEVDSYNFKKNIFIAGSLYFIGSLLNS